MADGDIYSRLPVLLVRRIGGRGTHLINERDFDPARHELADGATEVERPKLEQKRRGRPPKRRAALMEKPDGNG